MVNNERLFDLFCGNDTIKQTLKDMTLSNRLSHAILVEGITGCGKKEFAKLISSAFVCRHTEIENLPSEPYGGCLHCKKIANTIHPDVKFISGNGGNRSFSVEMVRDIIKSAYIKPNESLFSIFILCDVQNMGKEAQNALLKIIEQPPETTRFILTCDNRFKLLPTILSRVTVFSLTTPTVEQCYHYLIKRFADIEHPKLLAVSKTALGNIGRSIQLLTDATELKNNENAEKLLHALCFENEFSALVLLSCYEKDREGFLAMLRNLKLKMITIATKSHRLESQYQNRITPLSAVDLSRTVDELEQLTLSNGNLPLLTTLLCAKIKTIID